MFYAVKPISKAIVALVASTAPCFHHCSAFLMPLVSLRQFGANNSPLDAGGVLLPQRPGPAATRPFVRLRHDTYSIARFSPSNGARLVRGEILLLRANGRDLMPCNNGDMLAVMYFARWCSCFGCGGTVTVQSHYL